MIGLISSVNVVLKSVGLEFLSVIGVFLVSGPTGNQKEIEAHHTVTFNDDGDSISVDNSVSGYSQDNSMLFPLSYSQNSHCIHSFKDCINYVHEKGYSEQFTLSKIITKMNLFKKKNEIETKQTHLIVLSWIEMSLSLV